MNGLLLKIHPVYDQYAASRCGKVVNLDSEAILLGTPDITNKLSCSVRSKNIKNRKSMQLRKFVYECYNNNNNNNNNNIINNNRIHLYSAINTNYS